MKTFNNRSYFYFIAFMLMVSTYLPLLFVNLPPIVRSHHLWAVIWFFSLIMLYPKVFKNKLFLFVLLYGVVMLLLLFNTLWVDIDDWNKNQLIMEFYHIAIAVSVITYFRIEKDFFRLAKLVKWSLLFIFITTVMTIVTSIIEPSYARSLTGLSAINLQSEVDYFLSYKRYGGGGYSFATALLALLPILVYYFKNNDKSIIKKPYLIIFVIMIFFALLGMQIIANIIFSLFIIFFSIMGSKKIKNIYLIASFAIVFVFFIPNKFYADMLFNASLLFPKNSEIYLKLNDISKLIILGDYTDSGIFLRAERYPLLINAFVTSPLLGVYFQNLTVDITGGGHLHWMNKITVYGLLGSIPFFYIIYNFIKGSLKYLDKNFKFYFLLSALSVFGLGLMKALVGRDMWYMFFVIVPGLYYLPLLKKHTTDKQKNYSNFEPIKT